MATARRHSGLTSYWEKSSFSFSNGNCVEVRHLADGVHVRNSRDPEGAELIFTRAEWHDFLAGAVQGEFDLPVT